MLEVKNDEMNKDMDEYPDEEPSPETGSGSSSSTGLICVVCGDCATGRHYGSPSCNGCKGFFRRTIRRNYSYTCRFNGNCVIDRHNRAVCRACRYMRCIKFGMKVDAVQNERDLIGKRPRGMPMGSMNSMNPQSVMQPGPSSFSSSPSTSDPLMDSTWDSPTNLLDFLLKAENKIKSLRETVIKETGQYEYSTKNEPMISQLLNMQHEPNNFGRSATVNDIFHSLHSQLLLVIEWAKSLRPFADLNPADQTALLKNFASQHIVLCVAYRSINSFNSLKLINDSMITRTSGEVSNFPDDYYKRDCERVMDQLVAPMRYMQMDDYEFIAIKACVLFNPVARGLSSESVMKVLQTRRKIFASLENYVNSKIPRDVNRVGDLTFFILSPLQSLAKSMSEDVLMTKMSGMARIDHLMEELILEDTDPKEKNAASEHGAASVSRSMSENDRKPSNNSLPGLSETMGTHNAGNYDYDMLSTLSNYIMGPNGFNRPLSPLTDPFLTSVVAQNGGPMHETNSNSSHNSPEHNMNHSSSVSPVTTEMPSNNHLSATNGTNTFYQSPTGQTNHSNQWNQARGYHPGSAPPMGYAQPMPY